MTQQQLDALAASLKRIAADIITNAPLPAPTYAGSLSTLAKTVASELPSVSAFLAAHEGVATGLADFLAALAVDGVPYAAEFRTALLETPKLLADAEAWLPTIIWTMWDVSPAPTGVTGDRANPWGER